MATTLLIEPDKSADLRAAGLNTFDDFMRLQADGLPLSQHWNRQTVRVQLTGSGSPRTCYLKRLTRAQPEHVLAAALRLQRPLTQPMHEWHNLARLREAGFNVPQRIAAGQRTRCGWPTAAFLLIEAVPAEHTVADWFREDANVAPRMKEWMRRRLLIELGALARKLDDAGIVWHDLDIKHIFARPASPSRRCRRWEFWLIDVERLSNRPPTPVALHSAVALADLLDPDATHAPARQPGRHDFFIYIGSKRVLGSVVQARTSSPRTSTRAEPFHRRFFTMLARKRGPFTFAARLPSAQRVAVIPHALQLAASHADILSHARLSTLHALLAYQSRDALTKPGLKSWRTRDRLRIKNLAGDNVTYYLKRYKNPSTSARFQRPAKHKSESFAEIEARLISQFDVAGIPTSGWAAIGARDGGTPREQSALLLPEVQGQSLERYAADCIRNKLTPAAKLRHAVIAQLAALVRHMHQRGLCHRDLYLAHVFLHVERDQPRLTLIDLARAIHRRQLSFRWRVKDLAALDYSSPRGFITRTDRIRFLRCYQNARRATLRRPATIIDLDPPVRTSRRAYIRYLTDCAAIEDRKWIAAVARRTARMARHDKKHGRSGVLDPHRSETPQAGDP